MNTPVVLCPVKHRSAKAQADLAVIRGRASLARARTGLVNTARGMAKSYGERLRGCNVRNLNPEKAEGMSPEPSRTAAAAGRAGIAERVHPRIQRTDREVGPTIFESTAGTHGIDRHVAQLSKMQRRFGG